MFNDTVCLNSQTWYEVYRGNWRYALLVDENTQTGPFTMDLIEPHISAKRSPNPQSFTKSGCGLPDDSGETPWTHPYVFLLTRLLKQY